MLNALTESNMLARVILCLHHVQMIHRSTYHGCKETVYRPHIYQPREINAQWT